MALKALRLDQSKDPELRKLSEQVQTALIPVFKSDILDGRLVEDVAFPLAAPVLVPHGLGRAYKGYILVRGPSGITVGESGLNPDSSIFISLEASNQTIASLWVF